MKFSSLTRRTPFRIAALFAGLFAAAVALISTMLYFVITRELTDRLKQHTDDLRVSIVEVDKTGSFDDLKRLIAGYAADTEPEENIFLLTDKEGNFVAGNIGTLPLFTGWQEIQAPDLTFTNAKWSPSSTATAVVGRWTQVKGGNVFVGGGNADINDVQSLLVEGLGLGAILAVGLALIGGIALGARAQLRIGMIDTALNAVARGDLTRRVPRMQPGDDLDHVAELINQMLDRMQTLFASLKQVTADIAHDLKSPIGRVLQKLETLSDAGIPEDKAQAMLKDVRAELRGTVQTFDALLRITEIEGGARKARFADVDLRLLLLDVIDILDAVAADAGDTLVSKVQEAAPVLIRGDRELLIQAFINLIENAIRHCPKGATIGVQLSIDNGVPTVVISDNGPGIPESEYENVFRRLVRLEKSRTTPGSGLGLSLVAAIIELHDARITLGNNDPGLLVTVRFC